MMLPNPLYKYCDSRGIDILLRARLKVTPFNEFNDPFELAPRMRTEFKLEDAQAMLRDPEYQRDLYKVTVGLGQFRGSFDQFRDYILLLVADDLAKKLVTDYPKDAAEFRERHMEKISTEFGLICLSQIPDDILMWSHYTRGHTGFVIGFDTNDAFFAEPPVHDVIYSKERVLMGHFADLRDAPYRSDVIKNLIKTKSINWSYEHEWRQLHMLAQCTAEPDTGRQGRQLYFKPISRSAIFEVVLGCRCDDRAIREVLSAAEFQHVKIRKARIHDSEFQLVLEE